jgi:transposase
MPAICTSFEAEEGHLIKILWHDGIGLSLYAKRLERGGFLWPSPADGVVAISALPVGVYARRDRREEPGSHLASGGSPAESAAD